MHFANTSRRILVLHKTLFTKYSSTLYSPLLNGLGTSCLWKIDVRRVISFQVVGKSDSKQNLFIQKKPLPAKLKCAGRFHSWFLIGSFFPKFPACSDFALPVMAYGICDSKMAASLSFGALNFSDKTSSNSDSWQDASTALAELDKGRLLKFIFFYLWCSLICLLPLKANHRVLPLNI